MQTSKFFLAFLAVVMLFGLTGSAEAQTTSVITGKVQDQSGAVIAGAKVSARSLETNFTRSTVTDGEGRYTFAELRVGRYEVRAEQDKFKPEAKTLNLTIGETVSLDLQLQIAVAATIDVVDAAPLVNTQTSELSYLVGEKAIRELPLNGRNYTDLALLQPGVTSFPLRDGGSVVAHGLGMSINGQDIRSNVYLLDGTLQNDITNGPAGSAASTVLGTESIREFRVETNSYSAEFGRNFGGQINAVSKSGSNQFHGSAYQFHRNDNLDARNFFDREPIGKPEFKRNQFGGTIGGPIAKDKTFFFFGYEALRDRLGRTINSAVPDANARNGLLPCASVPTAPCNAATGLATITVANAVKPYLDLIPLPNVPAASGGLGNYFFRFNQTLDQHFVQGRVDHSFNKSHQLFVRYTNDRADQFLPTDYPQFPRTFFSRNQFTTIEHTWLMSSQTVNTLRFGFSRTPVGQNVRSDVPGTIPFFVPGRKYLGAIDIGGMPRFGTQSSGDLRLVQNVFSFAQNLVHTRGRHILKFGGLVERYQDNMVNPTFSLGIYTFADLANFLRGTPRQFVGLTPAAELDRYWRFTLFGFYAQDDFKLTQRLTVNLGLRYELATQPEDRRDIALVNFSDPRITPGPLYQNPTYKNISPRLGFAWDVFGNGKTSLRGGYGWYFNTNNQQNLIVTVTNPPATPRVVVTTNVTFPTPSFAAVSNAIRPIEWDLKNPSNHTYNLNLQHELPWNTVVTLGYAGSRGTHLLRNTDANTSIPTRLADGTFFFPNNAPRRNASFGVIELKKSDGDSYYNAMIFEVRKRFSRSFDVQSSYTWGKTIDNTQASTFFSDATNATVSALPELDGMNYNRGRADFDIRHNWVGNFNWELPFARGLKGAAGKILDGWNLLGIAQVRSGLPLTVFVSANRSQSKWAPSSGPGLGPDRPSFAPGYTFKSAVTGSPDAYFDPKAFLLQPTGTLGTLGRNTFDGPNLRTFDLALTKNTTWSKLGEGTRIQFRIESFNIFNRANFGTPNLQVYAGTPELLNAPPASLTPTQPASIATFGRIRSTVTSARQIQLGLRVSF